VVRPDRLHLFESKKSAFSIFEFRRWQARQTQRNLFRQRLYVFTNIILFTNRDQSPTAKRDTGHTQSRPITTENGDSQPNTILNFTCASDAKQSMPLSERRHNTILFAATDATTTNNNTTRTHTPILSLKQIMDEEVATSPSLPKTAPGGNGSDPASALRRSSRHKASPSSAKNVQPAVGHHVLRSGRVLTAPTSRLVNNQNNRRGAHDVIEEEISSESRSPETSRPPCGHILHNVNANGRDSTDAIVTERTEKVADVESPEQTTPAESPKSQPNSAAAQPPESETEQLQASAAPHVGVAAPLESQAAQTLLTIERSVMERKAKEQGRILALVREAQGITVPELDGVRHKRVMATFVNNFAVYGVAVIVEGRKAVNGRYEIVPGEKRDMMAALLGICGFDYHPKRSNKWNNYANAEEHLVKHKKIGYWFSNTKTKAKKTAPWEVTNGKLEGETKGIYAPHKRILDAVACEEE